MGKSTVAKAKWFIQFVAATFVTLDLLLEKYLFCYKLAIPQFIS